MSGVAVGVSSEDEWVSGVTTGLVVGVVAA